MKWQIPAKTFLVGEYIALNGGPSLVMTTEPCFTVGLNDENSHATFPMHSPAWNLCQNIELDIASLSFSDPYAGIGGLGASSAQFLGAFYASRHAQKLNFSREELLSAYLRCAWNGKGVPPSGYDVIAQHMGGCVHIDKSANIYQSYAWPFTDIAGILVHTQNKLATHEHLRTLKVSESQTKLIDIAKQTINAFTECVSDLFVSSINAYAQELDFLGLQEEYTSKIIADLHKELQILAAKGCGAMGADIVLIILPSTGLNDSLISLKNRGYQVIGTSNDINMQKTRILRKKHLMF